MVIVKAGKGIQEPFSDKIVSLPATRSLRPQARAFRLDVMLRRDLDVTVLIGARSEDLLGAQIRSL
jgi:hypothetical protein